MQYIGNEQIYQAFLTGAKEVMNNRALLNRINVFPVPDRDTGNNLYNMMDAIVNRSEKKRTLKETLESIAEAAIIGSRGNSGAIFAQYIQGFSALDAYLDYFTKDGLTTAAQNGVAYAYRAVETPVEGTMLTAMRVFHEALKQNKDLKISFLETIEKAYLQVETSVAQTTEQLINLKRASVIDSGAKGFAFFIKGFIEGLNGKTIDVEENRPDALDESLEHEILTQDAPPRYRYCTEALLYSHNLDNEGLRKALIDHGDSLVMSTGSNYSRVHIHTNEPSLVFRKFMEHAEVKDQKIDDMLMQYHQLYNRKYDTVIVTDSIADIPQSLIDEGQVVVIPLEIVIGSQSFKDGLTIDNGLLFDLEKKIGVHPTSSQPVLNTCEKIFADLLEKYEDMVVLTVSKEMSGTYNVISTAAKPFGDRIALVDTKQNSVAQGLLVLKAIDLLKKGYHAKTIKDEIEQKILKTKIMVSVKGLESMIASGRLNSRVGAVIKFLGLYPVISINREGIGVIDRIIWGLRNRKKRLLKALIDMNKGNSIETFAVTYVDHKQEAEDFAREAESLLGLKCAYIVQCSSVIAAGAGKGALAIGMIRK